MTWLRKLQLRSRVLFAKRQLDAEMDEELRAHVAMQTQENLANGMSPEEARYAALRQFGPVDGIKETVRDQRGVIWLDHLLQDLRYAARMLPRHPLSNAVIVLTIAVLIGAVSVIYASLRGERAKLMPFPEPKRLVRLWRVGEHGARGTFPGVFYHEYLEQSDSIERLGALEFQQSKTLTGLGEATSLYAAGVTPSLLELTGLAPIRGRLFDSSDVANGDRRLVLISEQMWRENLDGDEGVIGRELRLNDTAYTVIGVLPASMRTTFLAYGVDVWTPIEPGRDRPGDSYALVGRLKSGIPFKQAQAEVKTLATRIENEYRPNRNDPLAAQDRDYLTDRILPLSEQSYSGEGIPAQRILIWVFAGAILGSIVGIACFNITNLLLARHGARSREIAIRLSLGATRFRIVRQLLAETVLLASMGGVSGLAVSIWIFHLLQFQRVNPQFDWRLCAVAFAGTLLLGVLVGLVPALRSSRKGLADALKEGGALTGGRHRHRLRNVLVSSEIAMALVLCVVGGLLTRTYYTVFRSDPGFDPNHLVSLTVHLRVDKYPRTADLAAYVESGLQALRETPGVEAASVCLQRSLIGYGFEQYYRIPGRDGAEELKVTSATSLIGPGFPEMLGMPVLRGHTLSETDNRDAREVWINERFARTYFPDRNPIGQEIQSVNGNRRLTIAGILRDRSVLTSYQVVAPEIFRDFRENPADWDVIFVARTQGAGKAWAAPIREVIARLDLNQPIGQPLTIAGVLDERASGEQNGMLLLLSLAAGGLLIALTGVYGVVSFAVIERTRELGIRIALGASRPSILRLMFWQGARLMLLGAPVGIFIGAIVVSGTPAQEALRNISPLDPMTYVVVIAVVGFVGFCASFFPARRATRIEPMTALRQE